MSGSGDIDGEVSGEEAAWRDLIARFDEPAETGSATVPWPARENLPGPEAAVAGVAGTLGETGDCAPGTADSARLSDSPAPETTAPPGPRPGDPVRPGDAVRPGDIARQGDRTRIVRPAGDPRSWTAADEEDEPYVPDPLPPPAKMDPVTKGAWVALICGPAYLLLGTLAGWTISGTEALAAIAAFIAGFIILVVKMGDRPSRDDNDDGAVL
jgi:hypothetical protein